MSYLSLFLAQPPLIRKAKDLPCVAHSCVLPSSQAAHLGRAECPGFFNVLLGFLCGGEEWE